MGWSDSLISAIEKGYFQKLFNRGGYVLDFSTNDFDTFTLQSVGVPLCATYHQSKGKSLSAFLHEANDEDAKKLLLDLLDYYEANYGEEYDASQANTVASLRHDKAMRSVYKKCREIADRERSMLSPLAASLEYLKQEFSSEHISNQIELLMRMRTESPYDAIGKAKDLIESCCKTILERQGVAIDENWNVSQLSKTTARVMGIDGKSVDDSDPAGSTVKKILGNLSGIADGVAEFRNAYGSGHGKPASFRELPARHAKLAVGSAVTLVEYYWETYEWKKSKGLLK